MAQNFSCPSPSESASGSDVAPGPQLLSFHASAAVAGMIADAHAELREHEDHVRDCLRRLDNLQQLQAVIDGTANPESKQ